MAVTQEEFAEARALAMEAKVCFCMCGCTNGNVAPASLLGMPMPGLCPSCRTAKKGHERIASAGMYDALVNPYVEVEEGIVERRSVRSYPTATDEQREAADAYVKRHADAPPTATIAALVYALERGSDLTDRQVAIALSAEAAEARDYERTAKRLAKDHARQGKATDLTRISIPETLPEGRYAVEAETGDMVLVEVTRPTEGALRKATVVSFHLGDTTNYGIQRLGFPGFLGRLFPATYRGWYPQLVADLVAYPEYHAEMYTEMTNG